MAYPPPEDVTKITIENGRESWVIKKRSTIEAFCEDYLATFSKPPPKKTAPKKSVKKISKPALKKPVKKRAKSSSSENQTEESEKSGRSEKSEDDSNDISVEDRSAGPGGYAKFDLRYKSHKDVTKAAKEMAKNVKFAPN